MNIPVGGNTAGQDNVEIEVNLSDGDDVDLDKRAQKKAAKLDDSDEGEIDFKN